MRTLFSLALLSVFLLSPGQARAQSAAPGSDRYPPLPLVLVVEGLTLGATVVNAESFTRRLRPASGWVGIGVGGGLLNLLAGGLLLYEGIRNNERSTITAGSGLALFGGLALGVALASTGGTKASAGADGGDTVSPQRVVLALPALSF